MTESVRQIVKKLEELVLRTQEEISKLISFTASISEALASLSKKATEELEDFISLCHFLKDSISSTSAMKSEYVSPIQRLLSLRGEELIGCVSTWKSPTIEITPIELTSMFKLNYSRLSHLVSSYNEQSASCLRPQSVKIYTRGHQTSQLQHDLLTLTSSYLDLGVRAMMLTGGKLVGGHAALLGESSRIRVLPNLLYGRELHTMAWVDDQPAVIGGCEPSSGENLAEVEVLVNDRWTVHSTLSLPRSRHTSCNVASCVYIFGGVVTEQGRERMDNSIEKYDGKWNLLHLRLPEPIHFSGVLNVSLNLFIVFGGVTSAIGGNGTRSVFCFNIQNGLWENISDLEKDTYFCSNMWVVNERKINCLDFKGVCIPYYLNSYVIAP